MISEVKIKNPANKPPASVTLLFIKILFLPRNTQTTRTIFLIFLTVLLFFRVFRVFRGLIIFSANNNFLPHEKKQSQKSDKSNWLGNNFNM